MSENEQAISPAEEALPTQDEPLVSDWDESADPAMSQDGSENVGAPDLPATESERAAPIAVEQSSASGVASPLKVGFFYLLSLLTAGIGCAVVAYHLMGGQLASLTQLDRLLKMPPSVQLLLLGAAGGLLLLTVLGTAAISRAVSSARNCQDQIRSLLARLADLDLADEESWHDVGYAEEPQLARMITSVRKQYHDLRTKHARQISLEGEILRVEKALVNGERIDLTAEYDNPATARLADEILRLFDERLQARKRIQDLNSQLDLTGREMCDALQAAMQWNEDTLGQLSSQAQFLRGFVARLSDFRQGAKNSESAGSQAAQTQASLAMISEELATLPGVSLNKDLRGLGLLVRELEERGSKLGLKLALEVARLGQPGQSLLPLTEEWKRLTGDLATVAWQWDKITEEQQKIALALVRVREELVCAMGPGDQQDLMPQIITEIDRSLPALQENVGKLGALEKVFDLQYDRLQKLGMTCSGLTGAEFAAPVLGAKTGGNLASLQVERFDPFAEPVPSAAPAVNESVAPVIGPAPAAEPTVASASMDPTPEPGVIEPGAVRPIPVELTPVEPTRVEPMPARPIPVEPAPAQPQWITQTRGPSHSPEVAGTEPFSGSAPASVDPGPQRVAGEPARTGATPKAAADLPLCQDDDRVYDLAEFGAVPETDEAAAEAEAPDRIYDLAEFGAVALS